MDIRKPPKTRSLSEYINTFVGKDGLAGVKRFAKLYGWSIRAVQAYRFGERLPRPRDAQRIVDDKASLVTWESLYRPAKKRQKRRRA